MAPTPSPVFLFILTYWRHALLGSVGGLVLLMLLLGLLGKVPLAYNLRNLMSRYWTTALTSVAFVLVIGLCTVMMAFVNGMYQLTVNSGHPNNVIVLSEGATDEQFSNLQRVDANDIDMQPGVDKMDRNGQAVPLGSKEAYFVINQPIEDKKDGQPPKRRFVQLRGIEDPVVAGEVHGLPLQPGGQWFDPVSGVEAAADGKLNHIQAVIGNGLAAELGNDRPDKQPLKPGDTFALGLRTWIVKGVMNSEGTTFDSEVWAKRSLVGELFGKTHPTSIVLKAKTAEDATKLAADLREYKGAPLNAQTESAYFATLGESSRQLLYAIIFVAAVMSLGGVFGIMITMFAAVSQRTRDIGVLRLLGYSRWHILMSFLFESLILALIGGILGCAVGMLFDGVTAKSIVSSGQGGGKFVVLRLSISSDILAFGMFLSLLMGVIGGLVPALGAMRLRALESLR